METPPVREMFERFANRVTHWCGSVWATTLAFGLVAGWVVGGVAKFGFGDTYQILINTLTTIVTFLMVFLIQNTQNRESRALHIKVDALINAARRADNKLIGIENLTEDQLAELSAHYKRLADDGQDVEDAPPPLR